jgi:DNA-binding NtrC family response regulator
MEPNRENKKTILIVDDDPLILSAVSTILAEDGNYNILTANTGSEGVEKSRNFKGRIHLLLSDFQMPEMLGVKLATVITQERPETKVVLMSGFEGATLHLREGWHFLPKPFLGSKVRALVAGLLSPE